MQGFRATEKPPNGISYNAQVHPAFTADGKLLASWNMNRSDGQLPGPGQLDCYRPVFRSVDADLLDTEVLEHDNGEPKRPPKAG